MVLYLEVPKGCGGGTAENSTQNSSSVDAHGVLLRLSDEFLWRAIFDACAIIVCSLV